MVKRNSGIALVTALGIMVVVGILVAGSFLTTQIELGITRNDATSVQARYVATAGLEKYKAALFQYYRFIEDFYTSGTNPSRTACFSRLAEGLDWDRDGSLDVYWSGNRITFASEPVQTADGTEVIGTYQVALLRDPSNNKVYTLESRGNSNGARATVRATVLLDNTGVLEQAIFSGLGQSNKFINGGTTIRGGIYVVGDESSPDNTVIDSNGNFSLLNDYDLTDTKYAQIVDQVTSANRQADELCSTLRVMDGRVELDGSVKLGDPQNTLLGVYIGDDIDTDLIINTTLLECSDNKGVCSDDGPATFDITREYAPTFPTLDDPPNPRSDCTQTTWRECAQADAMDHGMTIEFSEAANGPVFPSGASFLDSDVRNKCVTFLSAGRELEFGAQNVDCTVTSGGVKYGFKYTSGNPGKFEVYGPVDFRGYNLTFSQDVDYYATTVKTEDGVPVTKRSAAIVVESDGTGGGDVDINATLRTGTTGGAPAYPDHVLAFIAENDIFQGGDFVMAPMYAGGTYRIVSDNTLIGSVVSNYFCTTGAGGATNKEKKANSEASADKCNAGQNAEVVYVNTGNNKPDIMRYLDFAGFPVFQVLSTEVR
ncbi:MAG: pilus assembly PilX N-terminal domain-containing protein [Acidimicrobiia bacterium]